MDRNYLSKFVLSPIRGGLFQYILIEKGYKCGSSSYNTFFYNFPIPFLWGSPLSFILRLFFHLYPTCGQLMAYADPCPISLLKKSLGVVVRMKKYCSEITSLLMRLESQLQSIQCSGSSFPLDIFGFPSFLYVYEARPYHQSFLEVHLDYQDTHLSCAQLIRGDIPPRTTFPFVPHS